MAAPKTRTANNVNEVFLGIFLSIFLGILMMELLDDGTTDYADFTDFADYYGGSYVC